MGESRDRERTEKEERKRKRKEDKQRKEKKQHRNEEKNGQNESGAEMERKLVNEEKLRKEEKRRRKEEKKARNEEKKARNEGRNDPSQSQVQGPSRTWRLCIPSSSEVEKFRQAHRVEIHPSNVAHEFAPILDLNGEVGLEDIFLESVKEFRSLTPVQAQTWPPALDGYDVVGIAQTGSGKTLAFGVPGLVRAARVGTAAANGKTSSPEIRVLVLSPTRELAMQVAKVLDSAAARCGMRCVCIFGGVDRHEQKALLRKKPCASVLVATPGRLLDFLRDGTVDLSSLVFFVLDEADRMLDLGFQAEVKEIAKYIHSNRKEQHVVQTMMFSATWPDEIRQMAEDYLRTSKTIRVSIGGAGARATAASSVTQTVYVLEPYEKEQKLIKILNEEKEEVLHGKKSLIIFCLYKKEAAMLERKVSHRGFQCVSLHGDKPQIERTSALEAFRSGSVPIMIATDVAARGLDIPNVEYVINYTFPLTVEDYVHRIGRTGRAGKRGLSFTFFTGDDKAHAGGLVNVLREAGQVVPDEMIRRFSLATKKKEHGMYGAFTRDPIVGEATRITFDNSDSD